MSDCVSTPLECSAGSESVLVGGGSRGMIVLVRPGPDFRAKPGDNLYTCLQIILVDFIPGRHNAGHGLVLVVLLLPWF